MPGQTTVSELNSSMLLKRKGFIAFLHRARHTILRSHSKQEIDRHQEGDLLMLRKRSYPKPDEQRYDVSTMELAFFEITDQAPEIKDAIWHLNYVGHALLDKKPLCDMEIGGRVRLLRRLEAFLVAAMLQNDDPTKFRGPESYEAGNWTYLCSQHGDFAQFRGEETVFYRDKAVYRGTCLGQIRT